MEFGLFYLMQRDPSWSEEATYQSDLAQMLAAESLGYSTVWIAEHHFNDFGLCPAPPVLAAHVAARTERLRVGMAVNLLPLHDPVDLAEQLAVLDQVSGGRLEVGIGRGGAGPDYRGFGVDFADSRGRVEEGIELLRRCWSGERFSFAGRYRTVEGLRIVPRPRQRPHPPLYIAANSEDSLLFAARQGLPTLSSFFIPVPELVRRHDRYREEALASGHPPADVADRQARSWGMRVVHVAEDRAAAQASGQAAFMLYQQALEHRRQERLEQNAASQSFDPALIRLRPFEEYLADNLAAFGSPDEVTDALGRYLEATGYQRLSLLIALPGLAASAALRSMELFAAKVAPQLAQMRVGV